MINYGTEISVANRFFFLSFPSSSLEREAETGIFFLPLEVHKQATDVLKKSDSL